MTTAKLEIDHTYIVRFGVAEAKVRQERVKVKDIEGKLVQLILLDRKGVDWFSIDKITIEQDITNIH